MASLAGRRGPTCFRDRASNPVAGAAVVACHSAPNIRRLHRGMVASQAKDDAEGRFTLPHITRGLSTIMITGPGIKPRSFDYGVLSVDGPQIIHVTKIIKLELELNRDEVDAFEFVCTNGHFVSIDVIWSPGSMPGSQDRVQLRPGAPVSILFVPETVKALRLYQGTRPIREVPVELDVEKALSRWKP